MNKVLIKAEREDRIIIKGVWEFSIGIGDKTDNIVFNSFLVIKKKKNSRVVSPILLPHVFF